MPTLNELVGEVKSKLIGYTLNQDRLTYLNGNITASTTSLTVGTSDNFAKGIIEIDDELLWVDSYNKSTGTFNIAPGFGRGYNGTVESPHSTNAQVTLSPTFPRVIIKQAINDTINSVYPKLWAVSSTTFNYNTAVSTYSLPDDAQDVLSVSWESVGPTKEWHPVRRWRVDPMANATSFNSNNSISIYDRIDAGRTVQVWYTKEPNTLSSNEQDFANVTGLPNSTKDVIILGAVSRLLSFIDAGRINYTSAEADLSSTRLGGSTGSSVSRYLYALYQQRLNEEASRLQGKYPVKIHYGR
jgi:hypothetical protein